MCCKSSSFFGSYFSGSRYFTHWFITLHCNSKILLFNAMMVSQAVHLLLQLLAAGCFLALLIQPVTLQLLFHLFPYFGLPLLKLPNACQELLFAVNLTLVALGTGDGNPREPCWDSAPSASFPAPPDEVRLPTNLLCSFL